MDQMSQTPNKSPEQLPVPIAPGEALPNVAPLEKPVASPESGEKQLGTAGAAVQQAYDNTVAQAGAATMPLPVADDTTHQHQTEGSAQDDIDVIEKEWVEKAKSIVASTKDDPRKQSTELSGMKREYVQKRFGKTLPDNRAA